MSGAGGEISHSGDEILTVKAQPGRVIREREILTGRSWLRLPAARRFVASLSAGMMVLLAGTGVLQDANANGDSRTLLLYHEHTKESAAITYRQNGRYVTEGLRQLNWFLRDWRIDEQISMDPKLFDIVWQVYREAGASGPIHVNSAYRSPQTNAALRRRSRGVAKSSQHMRGKALDFFLEGVSMARVREIGLKLQHGGVGFYPHSRHQFVHLDSGGVRSWPRLPDAHLARLFPDGRTVHIPVSGQPLAGYGEAKAAILARGGSVAGFSTFAEASGGRTKSFWARLFGGGEDEDEDLGGPGMGDRNQYASAATNEADGGARGFFSFFRGSTPTPAPAPAPAPILPAPEPVTTTASLPARVGPPTSSPLPSPGRSGAAATPVPPPVLATPIVLPPRRPAELAILAKKTPAKVAAVAPPKVVPPPKSERSGGKGPPERPSAAAKGGAEKAALRSLVDATGKSTASASKARSSFSSTKAEKPRSTPVKSTATSRGSAKR